MKKTVRVTIKDNEKIIPFDTSSINDSSVFIHWTSANLPDPTNIRILQNAIKATFADRCLNVTDNINIIVAENQVDEIVNEVDSIWSRMSKKTKSFFKWSLVAVITAGFAGLLMHADTKYNDGYFHDVLNPSKWAEEKFSYADSVLTNDWEAYKAISFISKEETFIDEYSYFESLQDLYRSTDGKTFVMSDLVRDEDGSFKKLTWSGASDFCADAGGWLMSRSEQEKYLSSSIKNFISLFDRRGNVPEWTLDNSGALFPPKSDDYYLNIKSPNESGEIFILADDGDVKEAFRCTFNSKFYGE